MSDNFWVDRREKLGFVFVLLILLTSCGTSTWQDATVVDKFYTPSSIGTGVGPTMGGKGGVAVVVTSTPEQYTIFFRLADGSTGHAEVGKEMWLRTEKGKPCKVRLNTVWGVTAISL